MVQTADTVEFPQLQFMMVVDIPFVPQTKFIMVQTIQQTTEFPQLQYFPGGRCSLASWFNSGYMSTSVYVVVFLAGCDAPRAVFPCLSAFRRRQQWQCTAGFTGDEATCAVFSFPVIRPKMRDIMAGMDEKDREFTCCSSTIPFFLAVTCTVLVLPEVYRSMDSCGDDFWMFPVFSTPWLDSGYIFGVSLRLLLEDLVFLRDGEPGSRGRGSHLEIRTLFQVGDGFFAVNCGIFRALDDEEFFVVEGSAGGGDAGSSTRIRCI